MNISIISIYPFPEGLAPTNRIKAYAKGLVKSGARVKVYMPFPTDSHSSEKLDISGVEDEISYQYTSARCKSKHKLFRAFALFTRYRRIVGLISSFVSILRDNKKEKIDTIILSSDAIDMLFFYSFVARMVKAKIVFIFDEHPIYIRHKFRKEIPSWQALMYKNALKRIDAYISISDVLKEYYNNLCKNTTIVISTIVDIDRFNIETRSDTKKYFCYMGNMDLTKDNIDLIVKAYALLPDSIKQEYDLHLYGIPNKPTRDLLEELISNLSLQENVFIKGKASFDDVPSILKNATILLTSQKNSLRTLGGLSTKLGEYLVSGTPALITKVGGNSIFLDRHKLLSFAEPESVEDYADQITYIIENYDEVKQVAKSGKQYIEESYSHIQQGKKMLDFLKSIQ